METIILLPVVLDWKKIIFNLLKEGKANTLAFFEKPKSGNHIPKKQAISIFPGYCDLMDRWDSSITANNMVITLARFGQIQFTSKKFIPLRNIMNSTGSLNFFKVINSLESLENDRALFSDFITEAKEFCLAVRERYINIEETEGYKKAPRNRRTQAEAFFRKLPNDMDEENDFIKMIHMVQIAGILLFLIEEYFEKLR